MEFGDQKPKKARKQKKTAENMRKFIWIIPTFMPFWVIKLSRYLACF